MYRRDMTGRALLVGPLTTMGQRVERKRRDQSCEKTGATVTIFKVNSEHALETIEQVEGDGGETNIVKLDISNPTVPEATPDETIPAFGPIPETIAGVQAVVHSWKRRRRHRNNRPVRAHTNWIKCWNSSRHIPRSDRPLNTSQMLTQKTTPPTASRPSMIGGSRSLIRRNSSRYHDCWVIPEKVFWAANPRIKDVTVLTITTICL